MAFTATSNTVSTTAVPIAMTETGTRQGTSFQLRNTGGNTIYLGGSIVTATGTNKGFPLNADESMSINLNKTDTLYAICATGAASEYSLLKQDD